MSFDQQRYERDVIGPLRGRHGRLPDDDLPRRYAVEPTMSADELRVHLKKLRTFWNQKAGGADSKARVCRQFQAADDELKKTVGEQMYDPRWWAEQARTRDRAHEGIVEQLAADLAKSYGGRLVTRDQLAEIVRRHVGLPPDAVERAVRQAGLRVVDGVELPTGSGLDRTAYRGLNEKLRELGAATVVQLLHPGLTEPFTLVHAAATAGGTRLPLDRNAVDGQLKEMERAADSPVVRARKAALRVLSTAVKAGVDLRTVALFQIVEQLVNSPRDAVLVRDATRLGLTEAEAELVVACLPSAVASASSAAAEIRDLLADGQLRAAQQALSALSTADPERAEVEEAVRRQVEEVRRLLREADAAVREQRDEEAERFVRDAYRIAVDDTDVETRVRRLAPAPPRDLTAIEAGSEIRLTWKQANSALPDIRYVLVRSEGREPTTPQDGHRVSETTGTDAVDRAAPAARDLHYAVFATAGQGSASSRATTVRARFVPALNGVRLRTRSDQITGSWQPHPATVRVDVRRTRGKAPAGPRDGKPIQAGLTSFLDRNIVEGQQYFYGLTAVYHDEGGREVAASMSVVSALPQAPARAVTDLTVVPLTVTGDLARVRLSWPGDAGTVRVRYADRLPTWEVHDTVPPADVDRFGREVSGTPVVDGGRVVLEADVPAGPQVYVPFAIGGTGAVVGRGIELGHANPVRQLQARRAGGQVFLTWIWPDEVRLAEVEWTAPGQHRQVRRVSRAQYVDGEGCVLSAGPQGCTVAVRSVGVGRTGESLSAPAEIVVAGRPVELTYSVRRLGDLRSRWSRRRYLVLTAAADCAGVDLLMVTAPGLTMPLRAEQGTLVNRFNGLRLSRDVPLTLEIELPGGLRRPYWIRCFAADPAVVSVVDPHINELKVA